MSRTVDIDGVSTEIEDDDPRFPIVVFNPVPTSVTNYQARAALVAAGLFAKVDAALRGADQTVQSNQLALQAWDYANNFYRASPFISGLEAGLGLTSAQIDGLFQQAALIS